MGSKQFIPGFEFIWAYKYDLLILTKGDWTDNVNKLELILNKLEEIGLKYIIFRFLGNG